MTSRINKYDEIVSKRLRLIRTVMGISQTELANALGVTFQQVQKYESGKNRVSAGKLYQIAEYLKMDVSDFYIDLVKNKSVSDRNKKLSEKLLYRLTYAKNSDKKINKLIYASVVNLLKDVEVSNSPNKL